MPEQTQQLAGAARQLLHLRALLDRLDPAAPPTASILEPARQTAPAGLPTIGILPGSFNPLTNAHTALAQAALDHGIDTLYLALSRRTVNKEGVTRPSQADRALVLCRYAVRQPRHGVLAFNRGLYTEQAVAARQLFPHAATITFVTGFDKAAQIFDSRYYDDRDAALVQLFAQATLLVAPRGGNGATELTALLDRPENQRFRPFVRALPLDSRYAAASATAVRAAIADGQAVADLVPPETTAFLAAMHPYTPPGHIPDSTPRSHHGQREAWPDALLMERDQAPVDPTRTGDA